MSNPLSELIERGSGGYGAYNRGRSGDSLGLHIDFSRLSLRQVQTMQHLPRHDPDRLFAVGKYQMIPATLVLAVRALTLDLDQAFDPRLQERIFSEYLLARKRAAVQAYLVGREGSSLEQALAQVVAEWPWLDATGRDDASTDASTLADHPTAQALQRMRAQYAEAVGEGLAGRQAWARIMAVDAGA